MSNLSVDVDYFTCIDSPEKAYYLGILFGDGCMYDYGNRYQLILEMTDIEIVEDFREAVSSSHKISYKERDNENHSDSARIAIGVREFCDNLIDLGLTPDKTFESTLPDIPEEHYSDFVQGLFDADGHISDKWEIAGGSRGLLEDVADVLPVDSRFYEDSRGNCYVIKIGKRKWDDLFQWLHKNNPPRLERKVIHHV